MVTPGALLASRTTVPLGMRMALLPSSLESPTLVKVIVWPARSEANLT